MTARELPIHKAIAGYLHTELDRRGVPWTHIANGEHRRPAVAAKLTSMGLNAGAGDILVTGLEGRCVMLEVKRAKGGRLSKDQEAYKAAHTRLGGRWFEVRDVDEVRGTLRALGLLDLPVLPMDMWFDPIKLRSERRAKKAAAKVRRRVLK